MRKFVTLLILIVCAALAMGGSFTCNSSTDDDFTTQPSR